LHIFFLHKQIQFFPSGAYTQRVEGLTEFQSDLSYSFDTDKDVPDLCIEVIVSSGGVDKLRKYQLRGVPEVWFWQDNQITVYCLVDGNYHQWEGSRCLPDLDLAFVCQCLAQDAPLNASLLFAERYQAVH
jgi:Uma2 family endonuclease